MIFIHNDGNEFSRGPNKYIGWKQNHWWCYAGINRLVLTTWKLTYYRYVSIHRTPINWNSRWTGRFLGDGTLLVDWIVQLYTGIHDKPDTVRTAGLSGVLRHTCTLMIGDFDFKNIFGIFWLLSYRKCFCYIVKTSYFEANTFNMSSLLGSSPLGWPNRYYCYNRTQDVRLLAGEVWRAGAETSCSAVGE